MRMQLLPIVTSIVFIASLCNAEICRSSQCYFKLDIRWTRTMTYRQPGATYNVALNGSKLEIVANSYRRNDPNIGKEVDPSEVHTADGYPRNIIEVNGQFPGPTLEVTEGAQVVVKVQNNLDQQAISIHWHGIHQRETPWMDGVPYVTQCPILPRHSFVYRFRATPAGTHWYHSHMVSQRIDGLYGMLIVHRKKDPQVQTLPLIVTDWYHVDATTMMILNPFDLKRPGTGEFDMTDLNANHNLRFETVSTVVGNQVTLTPKQRTTGPDGHFHKHRRSAVRVRRDTGINHTIAMDMDSGDMPSLVTPDPSSSNTVHNMSNMNNMQDMASIDPHAGHNMGNMGNMATADPHAGHNMGNMATADPHAGHNMGNMATTDPHAGHNMGNMATEDPHAGHNMGNMGNNDPHAGHNMGAMDPHAGHHTDHSAHGGHGSHNIFSPYSPAYDDLYVISGLINGKGRFGSNQAPLANFEVVNGKRYRFRVINAGAHLAMRVSLDGHVLTVVELDGQPVKPLDVDAAIVFPGERLDAEFVADQSDGNYWLRVDGVHGGHSVPSFGIVRYSNANMKSDPETQSRKCTAQKPCIHFNCPNGLHPDSHYIKCISLDQLQSMVKPEESVMTQDDSQVIEYFLNLGFNFGPSFNGYKYKPPSAPLFQGDGGISSCNTKDCETGGCECTYAIDVPLNRTIQLVLTNYDISEEGTPLGHHSTHLHGHSFYVLKLGYPKWDRASGALQGPNNDINCGDQLCRSATWRNTPKDLNLVNPVLKDTVIVPSLGYAVIRFKSDNPGMWLIHCHVDPHSNGGMTVLMQEAKDSIVAPPPGFPTCGNYGDGMDGRTSPIEGTQPKHDNLIAMDSKTLIAITLGSVSLGAVLIIVTVIASRCLVTSTRNKNVTV